MIFTLKQNSRRFIILLISILLIIAAFWIIMGFASAKTATSPEQDAVSSKQEAVLSEQNSENMQILSGAIDVEGKGISITLADNELHKNDIHYIVHDEDITILVNQLYAAGAEVISVNDERLIPISKIKADGALIKVNKNDYGSPFIIKAIGDPVILSDALAADKSYVSSLRNYVGVKIEKVDKLLVPRYKGDIHFEFAKPVKN